MTVVQILLIVLLCGVVAVFLLYMGNSMYTDYKAHQQRKTELELIAKYRRYSKPNIEFRRH